MSELRQRVAQRLTELRRNPFEAARIGGLNKHFVDDLLIGKKTTVKEQSLPKLAKGLDWSVGELLDRPARMVPLVGYVGAGGETSFFEAGQGPFEEFEPPDGATAQTVAVEIRGTSLGELFDRWLVFYDERREPVTNDLIGRLCIVGLDDGKVLVKKLKRGRLPNRWDLISNVEPPIYDAIVIWAARVKQMSPR